MATHNVKYLNPGKSGGICTVISDNIINGRQLLYYYIVGLFNAMLKHSVLPEDFVNSILIQIPRASRVDISNSNNYNRAVALSSIFGKI